DNSMDACEEAGILPELYVEISEVPTAAAASAAGAANRADSKSPPAAGPSRFRVVVEDNGPGIVKPQIPKIFAKLLYGSKFHRLKQSRGQQGIGISAAAMYDQLTTGKPYVVTSKTRRRRADHHFGIQIDPRKNAPVVARDQELDIPKDHGTRVAIA